MEVGKPNYDKKAGSRLKYYRLGMGDDQRHLIVRIAPPVKTLAESGRYAYYVKQHFGYTTRNRQGKPQHHPFLCLERKDRNQNITQSCPECDERRLRQTEVETKEAQLKAKGLAQDQIDAQLQPLKGWLKDHNLDRKWYMLAKDQSNEWGFLTIGHKCFEAFLAAVADIRKKGIDDPLDPKNGVWFELSRSGVRFNDLTDTVKVFTEQTAPGVFTLKFDELLDTDWKQISELPDVVTTGRALTHEQVKQLVVSGGDETVVKSIMESGQTRDNGNTTSVDTKSMTSKVSIPDTSGGAGGVITAPTPLVPADTVQKVSAIDDQIAQAQAALAALMAAKSKPAPAPVQNVTQPSPTLTKQLDMDPEDFIREFSDSVEGK